MFNPLMQEELVRQRHEQTLREAELKQKIHHLNSLSRVPEHLKEKAKALLKQWYNAPISQWVKDI